MTCALRRGLKPINWLSILFFRKKKVVSISEKSLPAKYYIYALSWSVDNSKFLRSQPILEVETGKQLGLLQAGATGQQALSPFFSCWSPDGQNDYLERAWLG